MSKKRKGGKVSPQDYPDQEDFDYIRDKVYGADAHEEPIARPKMPYTPPSDTYRDGSLVTIAETLINGTVVFSYGKELGVLDAKGIIHLVSDRDVYPSQQ